MSVNFGMFSYLVLLSLGVSKVIDNQGTFEICSEKNMQICTLNLTLTFAPLTASLAHTITRMQLSLAAPEELWPLNKYLIW